MCEKHFGWIRYLIWQNLKYLDTTSVKQLQIQELIQWHDVACFNIYLRDEIWHYYKTVLEIIEFIQDLSVINTNKELG